MGGRAHVQERAEARARAEEGRGAGAHVRARARVAPRAQGHVHVFVYITSPLGARTAPADVYADPSPDRPTPADGNFAQSRKPAWRRGKFVLDRHGSAVVP